MGKELEWKRSVSGPETQDAVLCDPAVTALAAEEVRVLEMWTSYFDTPEHTLRDRMITLRCRTENGTPVVCVKAPLPDAPDPHMHGEWELEGAADLSEALPLLVGLGAPEQLLAAEGLTCICRAEFRRRALLLRFPDGSEAELALDLGMLWGRTESEPLCELELEMKAGAPDRARAFLEGLSGRYGLTEQPLSKYARASRLG